MSNKKSETSRANELESIKYTIVDHRTQLCSHHKRQGFWKTREDEKNIPWIFCEQCLIAWDLRRANK